MYASQSLKRTLGCIELLFVHLCLSYSYPLAVNVCMITDYIWPNLKSRTFAFTSSLVEWPKHLTPMAGDSCSCLTALPSGVEEGK